MKEAGGGGHRGKEGFPISAIALLPPMLEKAIAESVLAAGFQKHVAKPVQPTELLTSIADLLMQRYN
ncbi:response regulator [Nostoc sp. CHAB 5715]|uniref:response regulator n=1 Tax=Nostoc sp. CHAB 5715 TaxID=2780400 RepID=UPI001E3A2A77|nr:response regulator [Nostoc sp. CHAB 5715]MCC5626212.1 response regulator [Nostoc sp. CHAB 5715]